jgi:NDP-sugar pyrophosphorylase family protein
MKALLLAAGRGTRLGSLTDSVPKILVPVAGRPLLAHQLDYLAANDVDEVAINLHHHAGQVEEFLARSGTHLRVVASVEPELLGTAGALVPLRRFLDERFVVLYGDVLTDAPLPPMVEAHDTRRPLATLACYESSELEGKGTIELDSAQRVVGFVEKGDGGGTALVNAGIYVCEPEVVDLVGEPPQDFGRDVWPRALAEGRDLLAFVIDASLRDVGTPQALSAANAELRAGDPRW